MHDERQGDMGIAELARKAGVTPRTIRYYVSEGLLPAPAGQGQRRAYGQAHLDRLEAIRELKAAYLPLHEIRRRLGDDLTPGGRDELRSDRRGAVQSGGWSGSKAESLGWCEEAGRSGESVDGVEAPEAGRLGGAIDGGVAWKPAPTGPGSVGAGFGHTSPSGVNPNLPASPRPPSPVGCDPNLPATALTPSIASPDLSSSAPTPSMTPPNLPASPAATPSATRPIGFGPSQGVGRIEIYEPTETAWRRHVLAQGVELHVRETDDPKLAEAIQRLLREAAAILDGKSGR